MIATLDDISLQVASRIPGDRDNNKKAIQAGMYIKVNSNRVRFKTFLDVDAAKGVELYTPYRLQRYLLFWHYEGWLVEGFDNIKDLFKRVAIVKSSDTVSSVVTMINGQIQVVKLFAVLGERESWVSSKVIYKKVEISDDFDLRVDILSFLLGGLEIGIENINGLAVDLCGEVTTISGGVPELKGMIDELISKSQKASYTYIGTTDPEKLVVLNKVEGERYRLLLVEPDNISCKAKA